MRSFAIRTPHQLYSGDQFKENKIGKACGTYGGKERFIQDFGEETLSKMTTWKTLAHMGGNIKINLKEIGWKAMDWIKLDGSGQERVAGSCECGNEPSGSIKYGNFSTV
jgi:hypothetical protein